MEYYKTMNDFNRVYLLVEQQKAIKKLDERIKKLKGNDYYLKFQNLSQENNILKINVNHLKRNTTKFLITMKKTKKILKNYMH